MLARIKKTFTRMLIMERCPSQLARSFCLGLFIALSTTIPFQTLLIFILARVLRAHSWVVLSTVYLINNPLTMVPIYIMDYTFGMVFFERILQLNLAAHNPAWVTSILNWLSQYFGSGLIAEFSFWTLMLGGLVFPLFVALIAYPISRTIFTKLAEQKRDAEEKKKQAQPDIPPAPKHAIPFIRYEIPPKH